MFSTKNLIAATLLTLGGAAHAQEAIIPYGVPLAPGETIIGIYQAPPAVPAPAYETVPYTGAQVYSPPPVDIDRVTGLPRNQAGWSGDTQRPAGIGCFPQGVCAHLN